MKNEVRFSTLQSDGTELNIRYINNSDILRCPKVILLPEHYRDDGSCRCNELNCEFIDGCSELKYGEEIYCRQHLMLLGMEDYTDEDDE